VSSTDTQNTGQSPLHSDLGTTTIQDAVVTAIISMAAEEVDGVATSHGGVKLPGDTSPTVGEFVDNITGGASRTRGLSVDVGERQTAADGHNDQRGIRAFDPAGDPGSPRADNRARAEPHGPRGHRGEHPGERRYPTGELALL
jgi:hypothetical protein